MDNELSRHFDAYAVKVLAPVDVNRLSSHQHEFNGARTFRNLLGEPSGKVPFPAQILYIDDGALDQTPVPLQTILTWYDARQNNPLRAPEYRLYYRPDAEASLRRARPGDTLFLFRDTHMSAGPASLTVAIVKEGSTVLRMFHWLLSIPTGPAAAVLHAEIDQLPRRDPVVAEKLLTILGRKPDFCDANLLDGALKWLDGRHWPSTHDLSALARALTPHHDLHSDPDGTMLRWLRTEHAVVRSFESFHVAGQLRELGFNEDSGTLSAAMMAEITAVNQRRQRWASESLRQHISVLLEARRVPVSWGPATQVQAGVDFLFPRKDVESGEQDSPSPEMTLACEGLLHHGWWQIRYESHNPARRHMLTVQPALSSVLFDDLSNRGIQLVIPHELNQGYLPSQQERIMSVKEFIEMLEPSH
ncbi:type II restriction endonuclease [Arthrobacter sp. MAHUQ-56]